MKYFILLFLIFCSCEPKHKTKKFMIDGEVVKCERVDWSHCGMHLSTCNNGLEYSCLTNLKEIIDGK